MFAESRLIVASGRDRSWNSEAFLLTLEEHGYVVEHCSLGVDLTRHMASLDGDLLLLDCGIKGQDLDVVYAVLTAWPSQPGVIVLCHDVACVERIRLFESGADDVICLPVDARELLARAQAVRRRITRGARPLRAGRITVIESERAAYVDEARIHLTEREWTLLLFLVRRANRTVSRTEVLAGVWQGELSPASNVLDVHIAHLRRKLGDAGRHLRAVRRVGYRLEVGGIRKDAPPPSARSA
jgi:DNA-binding response OmpR family regulator